MKNIRNILILLVIATITVFSTDAAKLTLSIENPRGQRAIGVGDVFYIKYTLENAGSLKVPTPSSVPGCKVLYFDKTGTSSSITIINGKTTQSSAITYTITLRAEKEGEFSYGPLSIGNLNSNQVKYKIGPKGSGSNRMQQNTAPQASGNQQDPDKPMYIGTGDNELFLKAYLSKSEAYEQEALVYTVKLYSTYGGVRYIGAAAAPTFDGFVIEESNDVSTQLDFETYNGKSYATAIIAKYIIFPQMPGNLNILGNTYTVSVNAHEYYHDPFFGKMALNKPVQLNVKPNDLAIKVKSLPLPKPVNFSGGVGKFSLSSELPVKELRTNQAASILYKVSGTGNIKYVKLPDLNTIFPQQLEVFSPTTEVESKVVGNNISGKSVFDYSFMPLEIGRFSIPKVELVYFNPESGKYESSFADDYEVMISKGEVSAKSQVKDRLKFSDSLLQYDDNDSKISVLLVDKFSYWLCYIIPIFLLVGVIIYNRRRLKELSNVALLKSKKANKEARRRLKKAANCMMNKDVDKFYDEMLSALWGYISDKLGIPTSELNRDNVSHSILDKGVDEPIVEEFISLLDNCEFAKYASSMSSNNMHDIYDLGCDIIDKLENSIKK